MDVKLKKWTSADRESLVLLCNAADRRYLSNAMPYPYTDADADWWLGKAAAKEGSEGIFRAIVADGQIVGNISVEQKSDVYCVDAEIGYVLLSSHWSKGIMTEAVRQICETAFEELDILRITGLVYEPNTGSRKVLEKNGFSLEGIQKQAVKKGDNVYDLCIYGKVKEL